MGRAPLPATTQGARSTIGAVASGGGDAQTEQGTSRPRGWCSSPPYECQADADAAWQSKAAKRTEYIVKTDTKVVIRETGGFQVFSGFYEVMEKAFLRLEPGTIATVVAYGNNEGVFDTWSSPGPAPS